MPIQRLDEKPSRNCTIQDITCDSDGKIANFISPHGTVSSLPVHPVKDGEHYYIGVFLAGAYQEILGDLHNLFGDTNAVHISVHRDRYEIDRVIDGETVADVLDYVAYNPKNWCAMSKRGCLCRCGLKQDHARGGSRIPKQLPFGPLWIHLSRQGMIRRQRAVS